MTLSQPAGTQHKSAQIFPIGSAGSNPTQSVGNGYSSTTNVVTGEPTPASEGIQSSGNVTIPATTLTAVPRVSSSQRLGGSDTTSGSLVYTSIGFHTSPSLIGTILIAFTILYVAI